MRFSFVKKFFISLLTAAVVAASLPAGTVYAKRASWGVSRLSEADTKLYDHLISELERILKEGGSTKITFDISGYGLTSKEDADTLWDRLYTYASNNHPELLCYEEINPDTQDEDTLEVSDDFSQLTVYIGVDKSYRGADEFTLDSSTLSKVTSAEAVAAKVISDNADKGTYDTIKAYADWIAGHVSYDHDYDDTPDSQIDSNSPWSMVAVFDNDEKTNVVCEGYAKAFQYLMDNTPKFVDAGIDSKLVTSTIMENGNDNGHMWNVVTIDGKNYIVDVTWYDSDSGSYNDRYLLGGQSVVDADTGGCHTYDQDTTNFYTEDELKLSDTEYDKDSEKKPEENTSGQQSNPPENTSDQGSAPSGSGDTTNTGTADTGNTSESSTGTGSSTSGSQTSGGNTKTSTGNNPAPSGAASGSTSSGNTSSSSAPSGSGSGSTTQSGTTSNSATPSGTTSNTGSQPSNSNSTSGTNGNNTTVTPAPAPVPVPNQVVPIEYSTSSGAVPGGDTSAPFLFPVITDTVTDEASGQIAEVTALKGKITKVSAGSKKLTVTARKQSVNGAKVKYQVGLKQSSAKKWQKTYVSSTKKTFKNLKKGKTYWVSVRPYVTVDGTRYFGKWSKTLTKKVK